MGRWITQQHMSDEVIQFFIDNINDNNQDIYSDDLFNQMLEFGPIQEISVSIDYDKDNKHLVFYFNEEDGDKSSYHYLKLDSVDMFKRIMYASTEDQKKIVFDNKYKTDEYKTDEYKTDEYKTDEYKSDYENLIKSDIHNIEHGDDETFEDDETFHSRIRESLSPYEQRQYNEFIQNSYGFAGDGNNV